MKNFGGLHRFGWIAQIWWDYTDFWVELHRFLGGITPIFLVDCTDFFGGITLISKRITQIFWVDCTDLL
jgi:hypothetical protein